MIFKPQSRMKKPCDIVHVQLNKHFIEKNCNTFLKKNFKNWKADEDSLFRIDGRA